LLLEGAEQEYWQRANRLIGQLWPAPIAPGDCQERDHI
jgi:hypothetical protein